MAASARTGGLEDPTSFLHLEIPVCRKRAETSTLEERLSLVAGDCFSRSAGLLFTPDCTRFACEEPERDRSPAHKLFKRCLSPSAGILFTPECNHAINKKNILELQKKIWDELKIEDAGTGFVRSTIIDGEKFWIKRPRHLGKATLASIISMEIGDKSVVPSDLLHLKDGTLVTAQRHCDDLTNDIESLIESIHCENNEYSILSLVNALTLSMFDDHQGNREGLLARTADLEACLPLFSSLFIKEDYGCGDSYRPAFFSALPVLFFLKGILHEPLSSEIKISILEKIGNPDFFVESVRQQYLYTFRQLGIDESCFEIIVDDKGQPCKRDLELELEIMLRGYTNRLQAVVETLSISEEVTPFNLIMATNPVYANALSDATKSGEGAALFDKIFSLAGPSCSPSYRRQSLFTEDTSIFIRSPTLTHEELWQRA